MSLKKYNKSQSRFWGVLFFGLLGGYGFTPLPVTAAPFAYVTGSDAATVAVIDTATNMVVTKIASDVRAPQDVVVAPDGKHVYVVDQFGFLLIIDTATNTVVGKVATGGGGGVAITPDGKRVYVGIPIYPIGNSQVAVIETGTNTVVDRIPVVGFPEELAVTPDGKRVYFTTSGTDADTVSVIDTEANTVVDTIDIGSYTTGVAVTPNGKYVYAANPGTGSLLVIDTTTNNVVATVANVCPLGGGVAVTPDGKRVYITACGDTDQSDTVRVIDTTTNTVVATVVVGSLPFGVAVTPDGKKAYVAVIHSEFVSVIDTATNKVVDTITDVGYPFRVAIQQFSASISAAFNVNTLIINQRHGSLFMLSNFTLGKGNNGISPTNEALTLKVGNVAMAIPAGSFKKNRLGIFTFAGQINNISIEVLITPLGKNRFGLEAAAYGAQFSGIKNPVLVELTIGNDTGITPVNAIIQK